MIAHAAAGTKNDVHAQRGFTLVSAVFLIVVLASLSAYLVNLRLYQEASGTLDTLGTRAYAAARSGVEWAAYNSLRNSTCAASTSLALAGTLSGFTVTVTCNTAGPYDEAGAAVNVDTIVATACNSATCPPATPSPNYVERQITVMVSK
jgi:MSHA biogenesis protein MshP